MLKRISTSFYSFSTGWVTLLGLVVFVLFMVFVLPQQSRKAEAYSGGTSPDTSYIYSAADLYHMAEVYGAEGRAAYIRARFTFDVVFPIAYLFFLVTSISWLLARGLLEQSPWRLLNLFPLAGAIFDFLENISTSLVLWRYPDTTPVVDRLAPVFTAIKWFFVNGSFVIVILGILVVLWKKLRK
ncbi:MAG: hypothetical protein IPG80_15690 [Anaerolineales bacterium]|jgi:hypothetical protein|uniref:hypothetical protein n=1 Tax=Candidatus Villigracilis vicinus TaxID=3140679 RepID=UPI0031347500|nr:hypothetical protein [Anaerolineales bacterium]